MSIDIPALLTGMKDGKPTGKDIVSFLVGKAVGAAPTPPGPPTPTPDQWSTDSWDTVQAASKAGLTVSAYGNQVGATRQIMLKDNTTATIRLSNATTDMYDLSDGSGTTGLCMEFVELTGKSQMNQTDTNNGGWKDTYIRASEIPTLYDLLPDDLKSVIATINVISAESGKLNSIVTSQDKLFLLAEREIFSARTYSRPVEWDSLKQWKYYADGGARRKQYAGANTIWWLRSPAAGTDTHFTTVAANGTVDAFKATLSYGIGAAFCI